MSDSHPTHEDHDHQHGEGCGHTGIRHEGHVDYVHDGHLHHQNPDGSVEEHTLPVDAEHPGGCTEASPIAHTDGHVHGPDCGHEAVPHGDHVDYIVDGRLHHPHGDHWGVGVGPLGSWGRTAATV